MLSALILAAAAAALPTDLAQAVHDYDVAQVKSDKAALERLLAPDYQLANSSGKVETKDEFIADQLAPGYKLNPFTVEAPIERVMGDVALMGGVADLSGTDGGKAFSVRLRFLDVWQKRDGRWQVVFTQAGRVPAS
ncbi:MAG: nuclear transport factor 2 family protein [Caulobacterales bacterium]|nr:nuclear transport factor 2 family protein [Caulobacterales bacterium]